MANLRRFWWTDRYAISWGIAPGDTGYGVEFIRTSDNGSSAPATSAAVTVAQLPAGQLKLTDLLPATTDRMHYNARHVGRGDPGPWIGWDSAIPAHQGFNPFSETLYKDEGRRRVDTVYETDGTLKADIGVVSSGTILVSNTSGGSATLTKTIRFPYGDITPDDDTITYNLSNGYLDPNAFGGGTLLYSRSIVLPQGITIDGVEARLYRDTNSDLATADLWKGSTTSALGTKLVGLSADTSGWQTITSSSFTQLVGEETYLIVVSLFSNSSNEASRFLWFDVRYTMPSYDKAY